MTLYFIVVIFTHKCGFNITYGQPWVGFETRMKKSVAAPSVTSVVSSPIIGIVSPKSSSTSTCTIPPLTIPHGRLMGETLACNLEIFVKLINCISLLFRISMVFTLLFVLVFHVTLSSRNDKQSCQGTQNVKFHIKYISKIYNSKFIDECIVYLG